MSFFTSLTGLNAATTQLSVTSNNIANAGTTGFKRSRSDFGDIFATSPLQKASTVVGQGTALKQVTQEFSQGNIELSGNSLDLAVTGEGFFPLSSADGQDLFTRNGSFLLDEQNTVVNSAGQYLQVASVDSLGKADFKAELVPLTIAPKTVGEAIATSNIDFGINFPAESLPLTTIDENNLEQIKDFNPEDSSTYAKSAAITIFDENGNDFLLTFYYRRVGVASADDPFNKWQTHVVLDGQEITPALGQATSSDGTALFVDKYGNIVPEDELPVVLNDNLVFQKFNLDDLSDPEVSEPATAKGGLVELPYLSDEAGVNFAPVSATQTLTVDRDELSSIAAGSIISMNLKDADGTTLKSLSTRTAASADLTVLNNGDIEAGDVVSMKFVDENGVLHTIATGALAADATAASIAAALNTANKPTGSIEFSDIADLDADDRIQLVISDGTNDYTYDTGAGVDISAASSATDLLTLLTASSPSGSPFTLTASGSKIIIEDNNATPVDFKIKLGADHSIDVTSPATTNDFAIVESISATPATLTTAFTSMTQSARYTFSTPVDVDGNVKNSSLIRVNRADGVNFKVGADAGYSLEGNAAIHEQLSADSDEISTTLSRITLNGSNLPANPTIAEIAAALEKSAAGSDFEVAVSETDRSVIEITKEDGVNFTVEMTAVPSTTTGLLSGLVNGSLTALTGTSETSISANGEEAPDLTDAFQLTINEDPNDANATDAITIDLSALNKPENHSLSGDEVANLMTQEINRQFGDQRYFDLSSDASRQFRMTFDRNPGDTVEPEVVDVYIPAASDYTADSLAAQIQTQLQNATNTHIKVEYDRASKGFVFSPEDDRSDLTITNVPASASLTGSAVPNTLFGLTTLSSNYTVDSRGKYDAEVIPNGSEILPLETDQQRYGIVVEFLPNTEEGGTGGTFTISSGKTGDDSAIRIEEISDVAKTLFGFDPDDPAAVLEVVAEEGSTAVRGVESTAAKVFGKPVSINPDETFYIDDLSNEFTVTVDSVTETFRLPVGNYNLNSFKTALQNRINAMEDTRGNSISGVTVDFDQVNEIFRFSSGTTGDSSFFQIQGSSRYGLEGIDSSVGSISTYRPPVADQTDNARPIYVTKDENGVFREYSTDTTSGLSALPGSREFTTDPEYRPLFLDKGELTFDTSGNLISPLGGISLDNVVIGGSGNTLNIDIDYAGSTQFSGDFSVNAQSQNGQPNGSLVAVDIADDGLVTASYSNGTQDLKGKIVLATFSTPNGLRQLGDSTFLESNESGTPTLGEPGGAGFGTIRAGARERANVDLTSELVDLITAQRNFQANAKAIETSSTLTSTIINIRS